MAKYTLYYTNAVSHDTITSIYTYIRMLFFFYAKFYRLEQSNICPKIDTLNDLHYTIAVKLTVLHSKWWFAHEFPFKLWPFFDTLSVWSCGSSKKKVESWQLHWGHRHPCIIFNHIQSFPVAGKTHLVSRATKLTAAKMPAMRSSADKILLHCLGGYESVLHMSVSQLCTVLLQKIRPLHSQLYLTSVDIFFHQNRCFFVPKVC